MIHGRNQITWAWNDMRVMRAFAHFGNFKMDQLTEKKNNISPGFWIVKHAESC